MTEYDNDYMKTVTEINEEIQFNKELMALLEVMKNISIFRFRALSAKKKRFTEFNEALAGFYEMVDLSKFSHPFITPRTDKTAMLVVTSDEGFLGGLNLRVVDKALLSPASFRAEILVVGERGAFHLGEVGRKFTAFKGAVTAEERYKLALELKDHILKGVKEGRFGSVSVFYPRPLSFIVQKVEELALLPISLPPQPRRLRNHSATYEVAEVADVIIESPLEGIVDFLVEEEIFQKLIDALEDSKLSEFAARAIHLEESNRELEEKEKGLKFQYFRAYHEIIDKNIRELFSTQIIARR